jgi:hypothetical protein
MLDIIDAFNLLDLGPNYPARMRKKWRQIPRRDPAIFIDCAGKDLPAAVV